MPKPAPQYIPASQYQVVGTLEGSTRKLYHVGYRDGQPIFCVAVSPDKIVPSKAITIGQLLTFNPMGWELDEAKIAGLSQQPQPGFDKPITSDRMAEQLEGQATPEFQKMIAVLERELKASTSPEDFLLRVEALYPELEDDKLIEAFHNGMYAAYLAGLAEAQDEGGDNLIQ